MKTIHFRSGQASNGDTNSTEAGAKENRQHSSLLVPFSLYHCRIPEAYPSVPMHWHEEFEIDYIIEGEGQIHLGNELYQVKKGDLILIPPNTLHAASPPESRLHYEAFVFHHSILGTGSRDRSSAACIYPVMNGNLKLVRHIPCISENYPGIAECVQEILESAQDNQALSDLLLKSALLKLFYLLEKIPSLLCPDEPAGISGDLIRPALSFMEEHYRENITISRLAECCNLSPSYFMSCFKKIAGTGAIEHLSQLRIMKICEELLLTDDTISEIAFRNGFDNLANFNRQFQKHVGVTPKHYRESSREHITAGSPRFL